MMDTLQILLLVEALLLAIAMWLLVLVQRQINDIKDKQQVTFEILRELSKR